MSPLFRKLFYALSYELIGLFLTALWLSALSSQDMQHSFALAAILAVVALGWNMIFNTIFETWEKRQPVRGRSTTRRAMHALLFEGGLMLITVPIIATSLELTLATAVLYDLSLTLAFMVYTYVFTVVFDHLFGLPLSAR